MKSLGKEYTKERIKERIEKKQEIKACIPKKDYSSRKLIDTSEKKFQNSPSLQRWATIENLKIAAQNYNEAGSISELEHKLQLKPKQESPPNKVLWSWNTASKTLRKL